eukprot:7317607-Prymnesium_polylepis.1
MRLVECACRIASSVASCLMWGEGASVPGGGVRRCAPGARCYSAQLGRRTRSLHFSVQVCVVCCARVQRGLIEVVYWRAL